MLADIIPTGYEVGVLNGRVQPGDVVAVAGSGPIGLATNMGARLFSPSHIVAIDMADTRLEAAKQFVAESASTTAGRTLGPCAEPDRRPGADEAIERWACPPPSSCRRNDPARGTVGQHRSPRRARAMHFEDLWIKNVTITTRLVDTYSTPTLLKLTTGHQVEPGRFVTHHFQLDEFIEA